MHLTVTSSLTVTFLPKTWKHQIVWPRAWRNWYHRCFVGRQEHFIIYMKICQYVWHILSNLVVLCWILKQLWEFMCKYRWSEGSQLAVLHFTHSLLDQVTGKLSYKLFTFLLTNLFHPMPHLLDKSWEEHLEKSSLMNTITEEIEKQLLGQKIHYPSLRWVSS